MPSQPSFPHEVHDYIIDFLFDDKKALSTCSLVSHEWKVTSQYHLFRAVQVCHPTKVSAFNSFLRGAAHLRGFVRDLTLRGSGVSNGTSFDDQLLVTVRDISFLASQVPRLKSLSIDGMWWSDTTPAESQETIAHEAIARAASRLRRLSIRKIFTTPDALLDTICLFPAIAHLDIERVYWTHDIDRRAAAAAPCAPDATHALPTLGSLRVGPGSTYSMLCCFLPLVAKRMDVAALGTLALEFEHFDAGEELLAFLRTVAPYLRHLSLKFGKYAMSGNAAGAGLKELRLSSLSALQSFQVYLPGEDDDAPHPPRSWTLLRSILPLLPPSVSDLTVVHEMQLEVLRSRLSNVDWELVDNLLAGPAFGALADVTIRATATGARRFCCFPSDDLWDYPEGNHEQTQAFFAQNLPQLTARGILSVV
ncbi:hypothetical protein PHLGIDRAFT_513189, partial [Phlebiopsis gigantea 11061_1 CR5-6]